MTPDQDNRIADALESLDSRLADVEANVAETVSATESLPELTNAVRALSNEVMHMRADFNRWVKSEAEQKSDIRKRLRTLEESKSA